MIGEFRIVLFQFTTYIIVLFSAVLFLVLAGSLKFRKRQVNRLYRLRIEAMTLNPNPRTAINSPRTKTTKSTGIVISFIIN